MGLRAGLDWCGKSRPTGIRSPDRPARRQSLYRLRYPAHFVKTVLSFIYLCTYYSVIYFSPRYLSAASFSDIIANDGRIMANNASKRYVKK